jgi:hypothetical protein
MIHLGQRTFKQLGTWARRRQQAIDKKAAAAFEELEGSAYEIKCLRELWEDQKRAQLSIRARELPVFFNLSVASS